MSFFASANATASATATASGSATSTYTATATSEISQLDATIIAESNALSEASLIAKNQAYYNALSEINNNLQPSINKYIVAIIINISADTLGFSDVLNLINNENPNSQIIYEKYIVDGTLEKTDIALNNFITKYPSGQRTIVSALTSILNECYLFLQKNNLNILLLSASSSSLTTQKLLNTITYGYYIDKIIISSFYIIKDYNSKNIVVFFENASTNIIFFTSYYDTIINQNNLLDKLPLIKYDLNPNDLNSVYIPPNSCVFVLSDTKSITNIYLNKIKNSLKNNTTSYLFLSNINYEIKDVFENIPAIIPIPRPTNYTSTSTKVYNCFTDKKNYYYSSYAFYDILNKIITLSDNQLELSKKNFLEINVSLEAYSNSLVYDATINGYNYGAYDVLLVKNSLLNKDNLNELFDKYKSDGSTSRTPDSQSILKSVGIVPFFSSRVLYADASLIKIYQNDILKYVKFDSNNIIDEEKNNIVVSNIQYPSFIVNFDSDTKLLNYLEKVYTDESFTNPEVNITMSKSAIVRYIK